MNSFIWKNPANAGGGGNIAQLEQEVQKLQTQLQQIGTQIQNLTQQLAQKAGKAEENNFTRKQKITTPNKALSITQDNNAAYISFERSDGTRRGYVGMGSSGSNKIHLNGEDGIQISSTTGDLELNPAGSINANNKPILNVGASSDINTALTLNHLVNNFSSFRAVNETIKNSVAEIRFIGRQIKFVFSIFVEKSGVSWNNKIRSVSITQDGIRVEFDGNLNTSADFFGTMIFW